MFKIRLKGGDRMETSRKYTLKELRARKNETQEESAKALGISTTTYNAWEKDISNIAISKVLKVATYFGVELTDIFFENSHEENSSIF